MLLRLGGRNRCGCIVQRDMGVVGDDLRHLTHRRRHRAVIVAGLQVGNHVAADVARLAVGQNAFQSVADFDPVLVIGDGQKNHGVTVLARCLILVPHLPVVFELRGVVGRVVAVEIVHGHHGNLRVGRGVVKLGTDGIEPRDRLRREHVRKIAYVVGGLGKVGHLLGMRGNREKCEKRRQQWRKQGKTRAARTFHFSSIVRWRGGGGSRAGRLYTGGEMTESTIPTPPVAHKEHRETQLHGVLLADDYAWLRDKENPDVTAYLEAENAYATAMMAPLGGLREELYQEMLSHVKQTDISVPYRDSDWWYYSRTQEGLQYGIYCRRHGGPAGTDADATEQILLDGNELAKDHAFFAIGDTDITDDGRWLAYSADTTGFRQYTLRIKDLESGETLADEVERVGSVVWAADNKTLFYTVEDEQQKRQFQLFRGSAGNLSDAVLVYQEDDERFNIAAGRTRDGKYIVLESASHITSEARFLAADNPTGEFRIIAPREDEHEYSLDHRNGLWFIRTNDRGRNFRLVTAPVETPEREHWTELIAHRDAVMLEDVDLFAEFFIACEREDGLPRLRLWKFAGDGA